VRLRRVHGGLAAGGRTIHAFTIQIGAAPYASPLVFAIVKVDARVFAPIMAAATGAWVPRFGSPPVADDVKGPRVTSSRSSRWRVSGEAAQILVAKPGSTATIAVKVVRRRSGRR
jgi:hypothetical protein